MKRHSSQTEMLFQGNVANGGTGRCQNINFECNLQCKFRQRNGTSVLVITYIPRKSDYPLSSNPMALI